MARFSSTAKERKNCPEWTTLNCMRKITNKSRNQFHAMHHIFNASKAIDIDCPKKRRIKLRRKWLISWTATEIMGPIQILYTETNQELENTGPTWMELLINTQSPFDLSSVLTCCLMNFPEVTHVPLAGLLFQLFLKSRHFLQRMSSFDYFLSLPNSAFSLHM